MKVITCIGIDNKIHCCKPNSNRTECDMKILRKKLLKNDLSEKYWCPYCDAILENQTEEE